jgi:hypothetical protein
MTISRRSVLRGAGAMLALPIMESLRSVAAYADEAPATGKPPLRMAIFTVTGGTVLESWKPKEAGALTTMPSILRPLEFAKDECLLLSGLSHSSKAENLNGHEHCGFMHLTAADVVKKVDGRAFAGISVDQRAAAEVGDQTYLPSLEMGLSNHETKYSFRNADTFVPYEANPRLVFERMFRGRKPAIPDWRKRGAANANAVAQTARPDSYERSVLDLVLEESNGLRKKLGKTDQRKLDEYMQSVRAIEKRIAFLEKQQFEDAMSAMDPETAKKLNLPTNLPAENTPIWKITEPVHHDPERHAEYIRLMSDLFILAFQTDTTRVATLAAGSDEAMFPGVVTVGYELHAHTLEHQGNAGRVEDADPIAREACRQIHAWYTELFAEMVRKMKQIDEGGVPLLDNCMLLYTSYMANGGHGQQDYPALMIGKAGGTLKTGRHLAFEKNTPVANLYLEMLERMGVKDGKFGNSHTSKNQRYNGRLPGLV